MESRRREAARAAHQTRLGTQAALNLRLIEEERLDDHADEGDHREAAVLELLEPGFFRVVK